MSYSGIEAVLELLAGFDIPYIFGNPGSTELPLNDALVTDDRIRYILGLQEVPVMSMADGYAMASGKLGVVNLHISCGLGNAMGMLYNAFREGTPLLVTAGQQDRRLVFEEPILAGDMVSVARPWTKWAAEVQRVEDVPTAVRRAAQMALTPPTGPVFLSIPVDVQVERSNQLDMAPIELPDHQTTPSMAAMARAASLMCEAKNPAILAGSRVCERQASDELVQLAEAWGAPVLVESGTTHGRLPFPCDHPLADQGLPLWSPEVRNRLSDFDIVFVVGMDLLRQYVYHEPARAIPEHIRLIHLDEDVYQIGKNYPVEIGLLGSTKAGLVSLCKNLLECQSDEDKQAAADRIHKWTQHHNQQRQALQARFSEQQSLRPLTPLGLMGSLARILPEDVAVIEEAVTTTNTTFERLGALKNTTGYFGHRGWALGWGLGCSIGVKLAWPDRPVLAMLGEGAAMYGIQGLWSAAHHQAPVTFVICNNAQYQILKIGAKGQGLPQAQDGRFEGMDIVGPEVDMVAVARALGVEAARIEDPDELAERVQDSLNNHKLSLFDVPISRTTQPRLNYG